MLKHWWKLDGNLINEIDPTADAVITDTVGYVNGKIGQGTQTDGATNGGITLLDSTQAEVLEDLMSITLFFKSESTTNNTLYEPRIITRDASDYWAVCIADQNIASPQDITFYKASASSHAFTDVVTVNQWHSLAVGWDTTNAIAFIALDGVYLGQYTSVPAFPATSRAIVIHCNTEQVISPTTDSNFAGSIDDVKIYDHYLSQKEITNHHKAMLGYWKLYDGTYTDSSDYAIETFENGAPTSEYTDPPIGETARTFVPANDDYYSITNPTAFHWDFEDDLFSVAFRCKSAAIAGTFLVGNQGGWRIGVDTNVEFWLRAELFGVSSSFSAGTLTADTWYDIVCTYDGTNREIFVDGVSVGSDAPAYTLDAASNAFAIGRGYPILTTQEYDGELIDVRIYASVLSQADITAYTENRASISNTGQLYAHEFVERPGGKIVGVTKFLCVATRMDVAAYEDNTDIYLNGVLNTSLSRNGTALITTAVGDILSCSKPFNSGYYITGVPFAWAGRRFTIYTYRYLNIVYHFHAVDATEVRIFNATTSKTVPIATLTLARGEYQTYTYTSVSTTAMIESDEDILVFHSPTGGDYMPFYPGSYEIFGIGSSSALITFLDDSTAYTAYRSNGTKASGTASRGGTINVGSTGSFFAGDSFRVVADKPICGRSYADGAGGETTPFADRAQMGKEFVLCASMGFIAMAGMAQSATVDVYDAADVLLDSFVVLGGDATGTYPTSLKITNTNMTANVLNAGFRIICSSPQWLIGDLLTGADETVHFGVGGDYAGTTSVPTSTGIVTAREFDEYTANTPEMSIQQNGTINIQELRETDG